MIWVDMSDTVVMNCDLYTQQLVVTTFYVLFLASNRFYRFALYNSHLSSVFIIVSDFENSSSRHIAWLLENTSGFFAYIFGGREYWKERVYYYTKDVKT